VFYLLNGHGACATPKMIIAQSLTMLPSRTTPCKGGARTADGATFTVQLLCKIDAINKYFFYYNVLRKISAPFGVGL
jgi:hypothetical protein